MGHPHRVSPYCVKRFRLVAADGTVLHACEENHHGRKVVDLPAPVATTARHLEILEMNRAHVPAAVFSVRCYA